MNYNKKKTIKMKSGRSAPILPFYFLTAQIKRFLEQKLDFTIYRGKIYGEKKRVSMMLEFIVFYLNNQQFAIELEFVNCVIASPARLILPHISTKSQEGINFHGQLIPVVDLRKLMGFETREIKLSDYDLIVVFDRQLIALWIDGLKEMASFSQEQLVAFSNHQAEQDFMRFIIKDKEETITVYDWNKLMHSEKKSG